MDTIAERADAIYPRIRRLLEWWLGRNPGLELDLTADAASEARFNAAWLDYATGGPDEPVKQAVLDILEANRRRGTQAEMFVQVR